jgi:RimJ/RimL family protein N-acetyltransferase
VRVPIETERLILRPFEAVDAQAAYGWFGDPVVLSALCRVSEENEAGDWVPIQSWILSLRRRGITVLLLHHAGKSGAQRGTLRREDLLDVVIKLKHPADYSP